MAASRFVPTLHMPTTSIIIVNVISNTTELQIHRRDPAPSLDHQRCPAGVSATSKRRHVQHSSTRCKASHQRCPAGGSARRHVQYM
eukprot:2679267-Rhodomonas_salina.1